MDEVGRVRRRKVDEIMRAGTVCDHICRKQDPRRKLTGLPRRENAGRYYTFVMRVVPSNLSSYRTCQQRFLEAEDYGRNFAANELIIRSRTGNTIRPESVVDYGSRRIVIKGVASWQRNTLFWVRFASKWSNNSTRLSTFQSHLTFVCHRSHKKEHSGKKTYLLTSYT